MWKDTEYFKNKGGERHKLGQIQVFPKVEALVGNLKIFFFSFFFFLLPFFPPRPAPLGCVPAAAAWGTDSGHRDGVGGQDPHRHLLSEQCALVSASPWLPSFPAPVGLLWGAGEGGEGEVDGPWASPWSCPVLMPFFTPVLLSLPLITLPCPTPV